MFSPHKPSAIVAVGERKEVGDIRVPGYGREKKLQKANEPMDDRCRMINPLTTPPTFTTESPMVQSGPRLVCALGVSHRDVGMALDWLKWTSFLATREGGSQADSTLLVMGTKKVTSAQWADLRSAVIKSPGMFSVVGAVLPDEEEASGYPKSASHLWLRTMEHCEANYPGCPVLWVEADSLPMRPGWFTEIEKEYATCGKPFMGHLEGVTTVKHMAGVAVYPPNWRELSPLLAGILSAPDNSAWGPGKGQAFDMYAAPETVAQMAQAKTIQQIWRPPSFTPVLLRTIKPATALFHQCKDGSLIKALAAERYKDFLPHIRKAAGMFAFRGHHQKAVIGHETFPCESRVLRLKGGWWSIIRPRSTGESIKLTMLCAPGYMEEVTKEQLVEETRKMKNRGGRIQHV